MSTDTKRTAPETSADFKNLVDLLAIFSEVTNRLDALQASVNESQLEVVDEHKQEYATLQKKLTEAENGLELIARRHPDWFTVKATLKTPYGSVALKDNPPKLEVANAEVSILLIEQKIEAEESELKAGQPSRWKRFLRQHTELNLEALAELTDGELHDLRIKRTQSDTFTVKPAKLDLGKAVKEAAAKTN